MKTSLRWLADRWLVGAGVCCVAYAIVVLALTPKGIPTSPDGVQYAEVARSLVSGQGYTINTTEFHAGLLTSIRHPPELHGLLEPYLLAPLFWAFGADEALLRVPCVLLLSVLTLLTFVCGRRLFGNLAGCLAAVLLLGRPSLSLLALFADDDIALALFSLGAFMCFRNGVESERRTGWLLGAAVLAGLGTLQKFSGIVLPFVFLVAGLLDARARRALALRHWGALFGCTALAAGMYALRNHAVHGGLGFRFSAIDWLSKDEPMAYYALYEEAPSLTSVFGHLGLSRVLELTMAQFRMLFTLTIGDPILMVGGPLALWPLRKERSFVFFVLAYALAMSVVVCVVYHVEPRYLTPLLPFYAIAVGGGLARAAERIVPALPIKPSVWIGGLVLGSALMMAAIFKSVHLLGTVPYVRDPCADAIRFIRDSIGVDAPILTNNPWLISWKTERPGVMAPTNGPDAVAAVARHYRTEWAFAVTPAIFVADLNKLFSDPSAPIDGLRAERLLDAGHCSVYRLHHVK